MLSHIAVKIWRFQDKCFTPRRVVSLFHPCLLFNPVIQIRGLQSKAITKTFAEISPRHAILAQANRNCHRQAWSRYLQEVSQRTATEDCSQAPLTQTHLSRRTWAQHESSPIIARFKTCLAATWNQHSTCIHIQLRRLWRFEGEGQWVWINGIRRKKNITGFICPQQKGERKTALASTSFD